MGLCHSTLTSGADVMSADGLGLPKNFRVIRELGYGGEGRTYLVEERTPQGKERFACKAIPRGSLLAPQLVLNGIRNQSSLCFVHVVKFLEVLLTRTYLIIKFEFVNGGDLFDYVRKQSAVSHWQFLDEEHARYLFIQMLVALHHCHEHRVAHRDVKFANLLCTRGSNPVIKICDFGLSKGWANPRDATSFSFVGTFGFMSPEVLNARSSSSQNRPYDLCKSDVWGLGVILYTMLFGRFPFTNHADSNSLSRADLHTGSNSTFSFLLKGMEMVHQSDPKRLKDEISNSCFSKNAKDILKAMLHIDQNERISLDELLQHPWIRSGLTLRRGKAMYKIRFEKESEKTEYVHAELIPGSPIDRELERLVLNATKVGGPNDTTLIRWAPPAVRLKPFMSNEEIRRLREQGVRHCSKCHDDGEDKYNDLLGGIKIMRHY